MSTEFLMSTQNNYACLHSDWNVFSIEGADAKDYLQRMTTINMNLLKKGSITDGTLLNATGRIVLYFKLLTKDEGAYFLLSPNTQSNTFNELEKFHFMEKFTIEECKELTTARIFGTFDFTTPDTGVFLNSENINIVNLNEFKNFKNDLLLIGELNKIQNWIQKNTQVNKLNNLEAIRIFNNVPKAPNELNIKTNPLEADLDYAVYENKGCYPGQEVIERIRAMGGVAKKMIQIRGTGVAPSVNQSISLNIDPNQSAGELTSSSAHPFESNKWIGLGFIKKIYWQHKNFLINGNPIEYKFINQPTLQDEE